MKFGTAEITTPQETDMFYDLDWRAKIARAVFDSGNRSCLPAKVADNDIRTLLKCLRGTRPSSTSCQRATSLHDSDLRVAVEAMLLTTAKILRIAQDTGFDEEAIRLFTALYFDIRDTDDKPKLPQLMRISAEMAVGEENLDAREKNKRALREAALRGGYPSLMSLLPANQDPATSERPITTAALVEQELNRRLLYGAMRNADLIRLRNLQLDEERMKFEISQKGGANSEGMELARQLLSLLAPRMADLDDVPNDEEARANLRKAEAAISQVDLPEQRPDAPDIIAALLKTKFANINKYSG